MRTSDGYRVKRKDRVRSTGWRRWLCWCYRRRCRKQAKERLWRELVRDLHQFKADEDEWKAIQKEEADWSQSLMNGLEEESP